MKHTCPHCQQNLISVHPLEVKAAVNFLRFLAVDPRATPNDSKCPYHNFALEGGRLWMDIARDALKEIPEESFKLWHEQRDSDEYKRLRGLECTSAATKLSDGWLPVGYVLDSEQEVIDDCPAYTDLEDPDECPHGSGSGIRVNCNCKMVGCTHDRGKGDYLCHKAWL